MRVYIVDDSPAVRARLIKMLTDQKGIEVIGHTGDANEALQAIRRQKPDALILAMHVHGGHGMDLLKSIRQEQPKLTIVILTNRAYDQSRERCWQAGANYFFDKSSEFEHLLTVFKQLAQTSRREPMAYSAYVHGTLMKR